MFYTTFRYEFMHTFIYSESRMPWPSSPRAMLSRGAPDCAMQHGTHVTMCGNVDVAVHSLVHACAVRPTANHEYPKYRRGCAVLAPAAVWSQATT